MHDYTAERFWFRHVTFGLVFAMLLANEFCEPTPARSAGVALMLLLFSALMWKAKPFAVDHEWKMPVRQALVFCTLMSEIMDLSIASEPPNKGAAAGAAPRAMVWIFFLSCCALLVILPASFFCILYPCRRQSNRRRSAHFGDVVAAKLAARRLASNAKSKSAPDSPDRSVHGCSDSIELAEIREARGATAVDGGETDRLVAIREECGTVKDAEQVEGDSNEDSNEDSNQVCQHGLPARDCDRCYLRQREQSQEKISDIMRHKLFRSKAQEHARDSSALQNTTSRPFSGKPGGLQWQDGDSTFT